MQAFNGTSAEFNVYLSESMLARILITVRTTPGNIPAVRRARARSAPRRRGAPMGGRSSRRADRRTGRGARQRALPAVRAARFRPAIARTSPPARRCPTSALMARADGGIAAGAVALPPARGARPACCGSSSSIAARRCRCPTACRCWSAWAQGHRRASAPDRPARTPRRYGCTTSACSRRSPTPTSRSTRCTPVFEDAFARIFRGEVENDDFNRLVVAARPAGAGNRRAARLREIHAPDRIPAVAGVHRSPRSPRTRTSRGC